MALAEGTYPYTITATRADGVTNTASGTVVVGSPETGVVAPIGAITNTQTIHAITTAVEEAPVSVIVNGNPYLASADGKIYGQYPLGDAPVTEPGNPLYVATTGSDLTGDGSEGNPWRTPEFGAKQLTAGDTLVIQSGTYVLDAANLPVGETTTDRDRALVSPSRNVSGTALNPITIKGAAGASVFLDAGASPQWPAAGTNGGDYLVLDNVTVRGCAILWGSDNSVVKNCDLYGGIDTPIANGGDNFGCVLRVENTTNAVVQNNIMRDNQLGITQDNSPLLMCYSSTGLVVENNDVYGSVGMGLRFKDEPNNVTVRYNYIYDNVQSGISSSNQVQGYNIDIYQNVIRNNNTANNGSHGGIRCNILVSGWNIYNNTFYENGYADVRALYDTTDDINLWNNIHSNSVHFYRAGFSSTGSQFSTVITYSDYNQFHNGGDWQTRSTNYTTLASYSSGETLDSNSLDTDPNFVNAGGLTAEDYKRTSYPANGRSGVYEDVMGAYVTGNETIGVSA